MRTAARGRNCFAARSVLREFARRHAAARRQGRQLSILGLISKFKTWQASGSTADLSALLSLKEGAARRQSRRRLEGHAVAPQGELASGRVVPELPPSLFQHHLIDITPHPILTRLERSHNGMLSGVKMLSCVRVFRRVATGTQHKLKCGEHRQRLALRGLVSDA